jgi:hypothetical protein
MKYGQGSIHYSISPAALELIDAEPAEDSLLRRPGGPGLFHPVLAARWAALHPRWRPSEEERAQVLEIARRARGAEVAPEERAALAIVIGRLGGRLTR